MVNLRKRYYSIMKNIKQIFQYISYFQYPCMLVGLYFCVHPIVTGDLGGMWVDYNKALVFVGIGMSFSTLQDTEKVQNSFSKKIYQNPAKAKLFLIMIGLQIIFFISFGLFGFLFSTVSIVKDVSFGSITLGIGMMGILKGASEMAAHQQKLLANNSSSS